jgi:hypothetical protein
MGFFELRFIFFNSYTHYIFRPLLCVTVMSALKSTVIVGVVTIIIIIIISPLQMVRFTGMGHKYLGINIFT